MVATSRNSVVGIAAFLLFAFAGGCGDRANNQGNSNNPSSSESTSSAANKLSAPNWTTKTFDTDGYSVDLPGETTVMSYVGPTEAIGCRSVTFTDSDVVLQTFVLPAPKEKYRSLDHFNDTYEPFLATNASTTFRDSGSTKVETNGKKGVEITFKRPSGSGPDTMLYRMFLADKVYVVAAMSSNFAEAKPVVDRFFNSLKINASQPEFPPDDGKPIPLSFRKYNAMMEGYQVDVPGRVQMETAKGAKPGGFERTASVSIYGTDMVFGVNAIRLTGKDKTRNDYANGAKLKAPDLFGGGNVAAEKKVTVDGQDALELNITTDKAPAVCRVVRSPGGDYGFEIFVRGSKLDDYRSDIDHFFDSFKFVAKDK